MKGPPRRPLTEQESRDEMCCVAGYRWCATCTCWHPIGEWDRHELSPIMEAITRERKAEEESTNG